MRTPAFGILPASWPGSVGEIRKKSWDADTMKGYIEE